VALGIAVAIIAAIANLVISSLSNTTFSKNQNLATIYAQEAIETVRKLVNQSYTQFKTNYTGSIYCLDEDNNLLISSGSCSNVKTGIFIREVEFEHISPDCQDNLKAQITVSWSDNKCTDNLDLYCHEVALSSCFVDINEIQSPI
jgi:Tfp pilus assembly protein PilV